MNNSIILLIFTLSISFLTFCVAGFTDDQPLSNLALIVYKILMLSVAIEICLLVNDSCFGSSLLVYLSFFRKSCPDTVVAVITDFYYFSLPLLVIYQYICHYLVVSCIDQYMRFIFTY